MKPPVYPSVPWRRRAKFSGTTGNDVPAGYVAPIDVTIITAAGISGC